jgi:hypothetical protein
MKRLEEVREVQRDFVLTGTWETLKQVEEEDGRK